MVNDTGVHSGIYLIITYSNLNEPDIDCYWICISLSRCTVFLNMLLPVCVKFSDLTTRVYWMVFSCIWFSMCVVSEWWNKTLSCSLESGFKLMTLFENPRWKWSIYDVAIIGKIHW